MKNGKIFSGVCTLTLATATATWNEAITGPGTIEEKGTRLYIHTEFSDGVFDKNCVVACRFDYGEGEENGL